MKYNINIQQKRAELLFHKTNAMYQCGNCLDHHLQTQLIIRLDALGSVCLTTQLKHFL